MYYLLLILLGIFLLTKSMNMVFLNKYIVHYSIIIFCIFLMKNYISKLREETSFITALPQPDIDISNLGFDDPEPPIEKIDASNVIDRLQFIDNLQTKNECVMCLEIIEPRDTVHECTCCKKFTHKECLTKWIEFKHGTCAHCRSPLIAE